MNLNNYQALSPKSPTNSFLPTLQLNIYGEGLGALGLPGDASPMSRFVKAAFLKAHTNFEANELDIPTQFFHLLDAVAMVRGSVITEADRNDLTTYSSCLDLQKGIYYYKTYTNNQISAVQLHHEQLDSSDLKIFPLVVAQQIAHLN